MRILTIKLSLMSFLLMLGIHVLPAAESTGEVITVTLRPPTMGECLTGANGSRFFAGGECGCSVGFGQDGDIFKEGERIDGTSGYKIPNCEADDSPGDSEPGTVDVGGGSGSPGSGGGTPKVPTLEQCGQATQ